MAQLRTLVAAALGSAVLAVSSAALAQPFPVNVTEEPGWLAGISGMPSFDSATARVYPPKGGTVMVYDGDKLIGWYMQPAFVNLTPDHIYGLAVMSGTTMQFNSGLIVRKGVTDVTFANTGAPNVQYYPSPAAYAEYMARYAYGPGYDPALAGYATPPAYAAGYAPVPAYAPGPAYPAYPAPYAPAAPGYGFGVPYAPPYVVPGYAGYAGYPSGAGLAPVSYRPRPVAPHAAPAAEAHVDGMSAHDVAALAASLRSEHADDLRLRTLAKSVGRQRVSSAFASELVRTFHSHAGREHAASFLRRRLLDQSSAGDLDAAVDAGPRYVPSAYVSRAPAY